MSNIREKIMAIERPRYCRVSAYRAGFEDALKSSADIAEAEVQRLEARLKSKMNNKKQIIKRVEDDVKSILKNIIAGNDIRDFSDDIDSILGAVGSDKVCEDFVNKEIVYWE